MTLGGKGGVLDKGLRIRRADVGNVPEVVGLSSCLFREDAGRRDPSMNVRWPEEEGAEYFARFVGGGPDLCLLAESAGEAIGYLAGRVREGTALMPGRAADLESMYVREEYRSRGVGARLVGEFLEWAGSQGAVRATVTAYAANERAVRFYEGMGFRPKSVSLERGLNGAPRI